jgi:hypothetical protein
MDIRKNTSRRNLLFFGSEDSCRFNNVLGSSFTPTDSARILLIEDVNGFAVDEKLSTLLLDMAIEATMNRIELEQISLNKITSSSDNYDT